ncbi:MAG: ABC transporter substrate-binding protein [Alphaproteobacteria bacterium]|nr:ABC transporter substrate-binding protein [Alphaproteobacteria bacterium]
MTNSIKRLTLAASALALMAGSAQAADINVGSVAGVTGPIAELVAPIVAGRNLAGEHVNAQGGLLDGDTYNLVLSDSQCDPKAGVDAGTKVVNVEQVVAIIGASCSGATNGMVQSVTIPAGVVALSDSATAPSITELEDNDLVFRVAPSDAYQGLAIAQLAIDQGYKKLAMTYSNDDYNAGIATVFEQAFQDLGGEITANQAHEPNKASYRSEISTLAGGDAEGLAIFAYYGGSGITIIRNSLENGLFDKFMAADGMFDASVIEQIGADTLRGNIFITQSASDYADDSYKAFAEAFEATGNDPVAPYAAHGYDASFLLALAIEKAGAADRGAISAALREVAGPSGTVIRPGEWEKAKAAIAAGEDINYEGASGNVDFDEAGDVGGIYSVNTVGDDGSWATNLIQ